MIDQLSLWEPEAPQDTVDYLLRTLSFSWADGDTSEVAAQRMLSIVQGDKHHMVGHVYQHGRAIWFYANVISAWIDNGVVWGECSITAEGPYVEELKRGAVPEGAAGEDEW